MSFSSFCHPQPSPRNDFQSPGRLVSSYLILDSKSFFKIRSQAKTDSYYTYDMMTCCLFSLLHDPQIRLTVCGRMVCHRTELQMEKIGRRLTLSLAFAITLLAVAACRTGKSVEESIILEGFTLSGTTTLITWTDGSELIESLDLITLLISEDETAPPAGSQVRYTIRGEIMESDPPQARVLSMEILDESTGPVKTSIDTALRVRSHQPEKTILLDVRTSEEYDSGHLPGAISFPLSRLRSELPPYDKNATLILYCKSGVRTIEAAQLLDKAGFKIVLNAGGILSYEGEMEG